jgi:hypothetical protein
MKASYLILTGDPNNFKISCHAVSCVRAAKIKKNDDARRYIPPEHQLTFIALHDIIFQRTQLFMQSKFEDF